MMRNLRLACVISICILNTGLVSGQVAPTFVSAYPTSYDITDTTGTSQSVAIVIVSDSDVGTGGPTNITMTTNTYFQFTDNGDLTGTVKTSGTALSGGSGTTQTLTFVAIDVDGQTATTSYSMKIINTPPTLVGLPTTTRVSETITAEILVYTITCTDPTDIVSNTIVSISPSNSPNSELFFVQIIPSTTDYGVYARSQTNAAQGTFNYNLQIEYLLQIQCSDNKDVVTKSLTVILIKNEPPVITNLPSPTSASVASTAASGHTVFTVTATDNEGDAISFITECNPTGCPLALTSATPTTAEVKTTVDLSTLTSSSTLGYDMTITPLDAKNNGTARILTILITGTNSAPTFSNLNNAVTVAENTAVSTTFFTVTTADADANTVTVTFTSNPTSGTSLFDIDTSGNVLVKSALNYETLTNTTYIMTVLASDTKTTSTATLTVIVTAVNEPFTWNAAGYAANVNDGASVGTTVTVPNFGVTDPDVNDTLTCNMTCSPAGYFSMSTNCVVTVTSVYSLDQGLGNTVTCVVTGMDEGDNMATTNLVFSIVDTNNYSPIFQESGYTYNVSPYENASVTLGQVNATDGDTGTFGQFTYSLNQTLLSGNFFSIDSSTGVVSTVVSMETCSCSGSTLAVPVYATDSGGRVGTSTVYVTLSVTSTTPSTTTTERAKKFLDDSRNTSWFAVLLAVAAVTAIVTGYVLINHVFVGSKVGSKSSYKPNKQGQSEQQNTDKADNNRGEEDTNQERQDDKRDKRRTKANNKNLAPPKHLQGWRNVQFL